MYSRARTGVLAATAPRGAPTRPPPEGSAHLEQRAPRSVSAQPIPRPGEGELWALQNEAVTGGGSRGGKADPSTPPPCDLKIQPSPSPLAFKGLPGSSAPLAPCYSSCCSCRLHFAALKRWGGLGRLSVCPPKHSPTPSRPPSSLLLRSFVGVGGDPSGQSSSPLIDLSQSCSRSDQPPNRRGGCTVTSPPPWLLRASCPCSLPV